MIDQSGNVDEDGSVKSILMSMIRDQTYRVVNLFITVVAKKTVAFFTKILKFFFKKILSMGGAVSGFNAGGARRAVRCHRRCSAEHICSTLELSA